jgi:hypothetical protein
MNASNHDLLQWLQTQIRSGKKTIIIPSGLLEDAAPAVLDECRRLVRIPVQFGHSFRFNPAACSGFIRPPIPVNSATPCGGV